MPLAFDAAVTATQRVRSDSTASIAVWDGNYYAHELERFLGLDPERSGDEASGRGRGAVRAGFVHYNDEEDARRLVEAVADVAAGSAVGVAEPSAEPPA